MLSANVNGAGMKAAYAAVKSEVDYQKRKAADSLQAKPQASKRPRGDENAHEKASSALIDELLETRQFGGALPPPPAQQECLPTDFSGLFPKAGAAAALQQQPPQQQQQQQRTARTFEDLASQRQTRQVLGSLLPGSDWLPPALPAFNAEASNLAATAAAAAADRQLPACTSAPLDWSLKTTVRFSSPLPFTIAEEAAYLSGGSVVAAQRAFAACDGLRSLSLQQRYLAALHSWQFPADPWRQPATGAAKLRAPPPEVVQRRQDWQAAFASLYDALRSGACDAFYYLSPEGTKKPFAVFFGAAGVGGRPRLHALLTRSSSGLRALMNSGMALGFEAPLMPADADRRVEADLAAVPLDGSQSMLAFEGALRVHGLFDFLLNESFRSHGEECDVPTLLAPTQFARAAMRAHPAKVLAASDARDPGRALHRLELRGSALPPWVVDRLAALLAIAQDGSFSMACDTHPLTLALNWCPPAGGGGTAVAAAAPGGGGKRSGRRQPLSGFGGIAGGTAAGQQQQLTDYESRQRGCLDSEEAGRWRAAVPGLSCNVLRELRCEGGMFSAKLSAKSAERMVM